MNRTQKRMLGIVLILGAVALGVAGWSLVKRLPRYEATATVKVERDGIDVPELAAGSTAGVDSAYFIETEIAMLQSDATLGEVITALDLTQVWGKRLYDGQVLKSWEAVQILKGRLHVQPGAEAAFITISATSEDTGESVAIADATALAYCDYREDYRRRLTQNALNALTNKFAEMEKQIAVACENVEQARQQFDPSTQEQAAVTGSLPVEGEELRALRARYSDSVLRYIAQSNQLALYKPTADGDREIIEQLKTRADKARSAMDAAEAVAREEIRKLELRRNYHSARFQLSELEQTFEPLKKTVEGLQHDLHTQRRAAEIVEPAAPSTHVDTGDVLRGRLCLAGGGVAFALGVGFLLFNRQPTVLRR